MTSNYHCTLLAYIKQVVIHDGIVMTNLAKLSSLRSMSSQPSLAVARSLSKMYSPARIGGYREGFSWLTQLGKV